MDLQSAGWLAGGVALLGGVLVTYHRVRAASGRRERAFVVRAAAAFWLFVLAFLAGTALVPDGYEYPLWAAYAGLLFLGTRAWNRRQDRIRREEAEVAVMVRRLATGGSKDLRHPCPVEGRRREDTVVRQRP
jgi:hypothetical protein